MVSKIEQWIIVRWLASEMARLRKKRRAADMVTASLCAMVFVHIIAIGTIRYIDNSLCHNKLFNPSSDPRFVLLLKLLSTLICLVCLLRFDFSVINMLDIDTWNSGFHCYLSSFSAEYFRRRNLKFS